MQNVCSDPKHMEEFKDISTAVIRMETKLDNILNVAGDHETRLRVAESSLMLQREIEREHSASATRLANVEKRLIPLEKMARDNSKTLSAFSRVLWAIAVAISGGVGLLIFDTFRGGM